MHLGRDLASSLFLKEKVETAFLHGNWDPGNFRCQECTTFSGLAACGHLKCWRVKREKLEDWSRTCAIRIFCQLHCAENTCDVTQSGCNWTGSKSQSSPSAAEKSTLTKNLIPETQSAQTKENLWASRAHCQYGSYLSERLLCLTNVCLSGDGKFYRGFSKLSLLWGLKSSIPTFSQSSRHHCCFFCPVHESFRAYLCHATSLSMLLIDVTLDIPEPTNRNTIASNFVQMVWEQNVCEHYSSSCSNSTIQMMHNTTSFLNIFTGRQINN